MCKRMRVLLALFSCCGVTGTEVSAGQQSLADENELLPTVSVTGTRLKRTNLQISSPLEVISRVDIESSGKSDLSDVVRSVTADNNGSIGLGNVSGFAQGSSGVSLRGLAVNATLVLINGRRMTSYGLADDGQRTFVNLSAIPLDIVDRIEILRDGGSAIYGSDAIAGVVNIIFREHFNGVSLNASFAETEYGDGKTPRASLTAGLGDLDSDRYNVLFNIEASNHGALYASTRSDRRSAALWIRLHGRRHRADHRWMVQQRHRRLQSESLRRRESR